MRNIITVCLLPIALIACGIKGFSQWTPLVSGTTEYLHSIYFKDAQHGFCAGGGDVWAYPVDGTTGIILRTTDGGANWITVYEDTLVALHTVIALEDTVIAFGTNKWGQWVAVTSADDGYSWLKDTISYSVKDICYYNDVLYVLDDSNGGALKKMSQGMLQPVQPDALLFDINEGGDIFCITYSATAGFYFDLLVSDDGGASWDTMNINAPVITHNSLTNASLWAFGDTVVFYATYPTAIAYSNNRGATWTYFNPPGASPGSGAYVLSPDIVLGKLYPKYIMESGNKGFTFNMQDSTSSAIARFHFTDEHTGYLCGADGIIYKTNNAGGATAIKGMERQTGAIATYPNPAKEVVNIAYPKGVNVKNVRLINAAGQEVFCANEAVAHINMKQLQAGNYLLVMTTNERQVVTQVVKQ